MTEVADPAPPPDELAWLDLARGIAPHLLSLPFGDDFEAFGFLAHVLLKRYPSAMHPALARQLADAIVRTTDARAVRVLPCVSRA